MFRRRFAMLAAVPALAAVGIASAPGAHAAVGQTPLQKNLQRAVAQIHRSAATTVGGDCNLVVPRYERVVSADRAINVHVTGACGNNQVIHAVWFSGRTLSEANDAIVFDGNAYSGSWTLDAATRLGTRSWHPWAAVDGTGRIAYQQNAPQTTIRTGSWAGLHVTRSGNKVTINARAVRYATSLDRTIPWVGATGIIQYRPAGGSTWYGLKDVTNNASGAYSYTYSTAAARDYRVLYTAGDYIWGATGPSVSDKGTVTPRVLQLTPGDAFTTGQKGVLCEAGLDNLICASNTAAPYGVSAPAAKKICGNAALQGIVLSDSRWNWFCGTGVPIVPTKASNAWALPHGLPVDSKLDAPVIPNNWTFAVNGLPCHVSSDGAVGCAATNSRNTGFVADSRYIYPRGVNAN